MYVCIFLLVVPCYFGGISISFLLQIFFLRSMMWPNQWKVIWHSALNLFPILCRFFSVLDMNSSEYGSLLAALNWEWIFVPKGFALLEMSETNAVSERLKLLNYCGYFWSSDYFAAGHSNTVKWHCHKLFTFSVYLFVVLVCNCLLPQPSFFQNETCVAVFFHDKRLESPEHLMNTYYLEWCSFRFK